MNKRLLPVRYKLTPKQINLLLNAIQAGDIYIHEDEDGVPVLDTWTTEVDYDLHLLPSRPLAPSDIDGPVEPTVPERDRLLGCMLLHLAGWEPDTAGWAAKLTPLPEIITYYLAR